MKTSLKLTLAFFLVLFFSTCKKDCCQDPTNPECENYDPCYGKTRINSNFRVRPGDRGFKPPEDWCDLIPCDTFSETSVRFDIPLNNPNNSTYEWQIGNEPEPRKTNKGFEVDFSDYLKADNWRKHLSVTLTIKTPLNSCMTQADDTLIQVTRNLYFEPFGYSLIKRNESFASFKGYFTNEPNKSVTLTLIQQMIGNFRGVEAPFALTIGLKSVDTLLHPVTHLVEMCQNYKNSKIKILFPEQNTPKLSFYFSYIENYFINENKIRLIYEFKKPTGFERYEFIGDRI
ncbi:MAG: hypothetical protein Q8K70_04905 [Bacteroidota bacterium]|nr:hypothetical protein [Bacteroidota bacterium]